MEKEMMSGANRENLDLKKNLNEANRKLNDAETREANFVKKEADFVEKMEAMKKELAENKLAMDGRVQKAEAEGERLRGVVEEVKRTRDAVQASNKELAQEVVALKVSLEKNWLAAWRADIMLVMKGSRTRRAILLVTALRIIARIWPRRSL